MKKVFEIIDTETLHEILDHAEYGTLAVCSDERPYAVPVNFVRIDKALFFHGALSNKKMKILERNPRISFSVVENYALIPSFFSSTEELACPATQFFRSVSIEGRAEMVSGREEKAAVFEAMMQKLQPEGGYRSFSDAAYDKALKATAVVKIVPEHIAGKAKFGQNLSTERFERIVAHLESRGNAVDLRTIELMNRARSKREQEKR